MFRTLLSVRMSDAISLNIFCLKTVSKWLISRWLGLLQNSRGLPKASLTFQNVIIDDVDDMKVSDGIQPWRCLAAMPCLLEQTL